MKLQKVIVDAGPLVSFINKNDRYHEWAITQFATMSPPLLTCEAVLSESCFLLRNFENGAINVLELLERGLLAIPFRLEDELSAIKILLNKYKNIPMSLADGCLVRMAEQISDSIVFTLDSDFKVYRKNRRKVIPTIMPNDL
jgi:predicted nucleic acid-binding protein